MSSTLLITGFGPFPAAAENPSGYLVERLQADEHLRLSSRLPLAFAVLPTEWERIVPKFLALVQRHRPQYALHFGYAAEAPGFQIEACAYNESCGREDACGEVLAAGHISDDPRRQLETALSVDAMVSLLERHKLPTTCSTDPGRYLCNNLYFRSLQQGLAALFVHIPALATADGVLPRSHAGAPPLPLDAALRGARLIIAAIEETAADLDGEHFF